MTVSGIYRLHLVCDAKDCRETDEGPSTKDFFGSSFAATRQEAIEAGWRVGSKVCVCPVCRAVNARPVYVGGRVARTPTDEQLANAKLRAQHTCVMRVTSRGCRACDRGVPYPHQTIDEIIDGFEHTRSR